MGQHLSDVTAVVRQDEDIFGTRVYLIQMVGGRRYIAKPVELEFEQFEANQRLPEPTFVFAGNHGTAFLQSLSDSLFEMGFRPSGDKQLAASASAELRATKLHLEDMRSMSNQLLKASIEMLVTKLT